MEWSALLSCSVTAEKVRRGGRSREKRMEEAIVNVPQGIPIHLVRLKQRAFERKYGISYRLIERTGEVVLCGGANEVKDAEKELHTALSRMNKKPLPVHKGPLRFFAAKDGPSYTWEFVPADPVSDVDTQVFPFELVRRTHEAANRVAVGRDDFMFNFDEQFIQTMTKTVDRLAASKYHVKIDGNFGRKLFNLIDVRPNLEYTWEELRSKNRFTAVKSSWSNVCGHEAPGLNALIADLRQQAYEMGINEPKEKLTVWVRVGEDKETDYQVRYIRRNGRWERKKSSVYPTAHTVHDIILANNLSVRVWSYPKDVPIGNKWDHVTSALQVHDGADGDLFSTDIAFMEDDAPEEATIRWKSIKSQLKIPFADLVFKLSQVRNEVMLEVGLPKSHAKFSTPGEKFTLLLQRLEELFFERYASE